MTERWVHPELKKIAEAVSRGESPKEHVRTIVRWFGYHRRSRHVVSQIAKSLSSLKLGTVPYFDWTALDDLVSFVDIETAIKASPYAYPSVEKKPDPKAIPDSQRTAAESPLLISLGDGTSQTDSITTALITDPSYRVGRLDIGNRTPISVKPDATVSEAATLMLKHDYSQLPVMSSERTVKGLFSWKSYGSRVCLDRKIAFVREAMDEAAVRSHDVSIFQVVAALSDHECVLVQGKDGVISGIITPYDISLTFGQLGEPFLLLSEIENSLRLLIHGRFTQDELRQTKNPADSEREIREPKDLTFGECVRLLEYQTRWAKLDLQLDRPTFVKDLDTIRGLRNDVMHFDPEGLDDKELKKLREFVAFLQRVRAIKTGS